MTAPSVSPRWNRLGSELREARIQELEALERQRYTPLRRIMFLLLCVVALGFGAALAIIARMALL